MNSSDTAHQQLDSDLPDAADSFFKVAAMAAGTLALLDNHGGAGTDSELCLVWHSLRGVVDMANSLGEKFGA